ncbi:YciI family protein [Hoyosella subflava]|uniref:YCII-related domain-containing protein n=1 Tax=Hoyosella subflava (strain DSM 45089 / JCM 17490 / NBRC 109087 / DQS3-9A1) TaxID=443218 RepID=F6EFN9_HOYSD|nr:YciI family protein [Hoyosella subflava]AEF40968.1 hypothetical protein AS9A_2521 [Hoyosella subflava DQS3-9A1]
MNNYLLSVIQPVGDPPPPDTLEPIMRNIESFHEELKAAGAWVFAGGLFPPDTATVVRQNGDGALVTDGPYTESKECLGGLVIVRAPDLDAALEWGRKAARATTLPIEVRPFQGTSE